VTPVITLTDAPSAAAQAAIGDGLGRYNADKRGYRVFGTIPCDPPGTRRTFFVKELA
jgi:hypothetical protein